MAWLDGNTVKDPESCRLSQMILGGANTEMSGMWLRYEVLSLHITLLREELGRGL